MGEAEILNGLAAVENEAGHLLTALDLLQRAEDALGPPLSGLSGRKFELRTADQEGLAEGNTDVDEGDTRQERAELRGVLKHNRGSALFRLGRLEEAAQTLVASQRHLAWVGAPDWRRAIVFLELSRVERLRENRSSARRFVEQGLELSADLLPTHHAGLYQMSARLHFEAGEHAKAEAALHKALECLPDPTHSLAVAHLLSDYGELELLRGRPVRALSWLGKALARAGEEPDATFVSHTRHLRSRALASLGDIDGAIFEADAGLEVLEGVRVAWGAAGTHFYSLRHGHYRHRLDLAARALDSLDALAVFEQFRARGMLARLFQPIPDLSSVEAEESASLRHELLLALRDLDSWQPGGGDPASAVAGALGIGAMGEGAVDEGAVGERAPGEEPGGRDPWREYLHRRYHRVDQENRELERQAVGTTAPEDLDGVESAASPSFGPSGFVPAKAAVLILTEGEEATYGLMLDPRISGRRPTAFTVETPPERLQELLATAAEAFRSIGSQGRRANREWAVRELGEALLGPIEDRLPGLEKLIIVADGKLEGFPFEAILLPTSGQPLLEEIEVSYSPSLAVLQAIQRRSARCESSRESVLALGDPIFGSRDPRWPPGVASPRSADEDLRWARLQGSRREAVGVARVAAPAVSPDAATDSKLLLGPQATRARLLAEVGQHGILHLASHSRSDGEHPEFSRLMLSCVDTRGRPVELCDLYLPEVAALELCGQLVVLSACDTATGTVLAGEGTHGLARAFLHAGARQVVASLWKVDDEITAGLMIDFHARLAAGAAPAAALRQAKLELLRAGRPTSDWAAFILMGADG